MRRTRALYCNKLRTTDEQRESISRGVVISAPPPATFNPAAPRPHVSRHREEDRGIRLLPKFKIDCF